MQLLRRGLRSHRHLRLAVVWAWCIGGGLAAQEVPKSWTERETRLANEYLSLLVNQPDYGRVVDLLWALYEKHEATPLLLENISAQAQATKHPTVLLVQGHLYRRAGDLKKAGELYDEVLKQMPKDVRALRARADVARELADPALAYTLIQRWVDSLSAEDPAKPQAWIELGTLALAAGKTEDAAQAWETAARLRPGDIHLVRQVGELLLRAGFPDRAVVFYNTLAEQGDPKKRLDALYDLARILEHADEFTKADETLLKGLSLLDFRDGRYAEFFRRRVRLHERFGGLDDLGHQLSKAAEAKPFREQAVLDWMRFNEITVDLDTHLAALRVLVKELPQVDDYRWELVRALLDHEGAAEAATLLDERLKNDGNDLPTLVFLRSDADLRLSHPEAAVVRLERLLSKQGQSVEIEKQILNFAQTRALDALIEKILQTRVDREPNKAEAIFELAAFFRVRKDGKRAETLLRKFSDEAPTEEEKQRRLNDAASFLAAGSDPERAMEIAVETANQPKAGREEWLRLADLLAEEGKTKEAGVWLEKAWSISTTDEERLDVDERLFSVLMGDKKLEAQTQRGTAGDFKLPDAFTGRGFAGAEVQPNQIELPAAITAYTRAQVDRVLGKPGQGPSAPVSEAVLFRAAWWAMRAEMLEDAYRLISRLQVDSQTGTLRELSLEAEKMLLDLTFTDKNKALSMRLLKRLSQRDPTNRLRYILRLSELMMEVEQSSSVTAQNRRWKTEGPLQMVIKDAVRLLEQAYREMPDSDQLLSALTQSYRIQGRPDDALKLWREAIQKASGTSAVPLLERYADLLYSQAKLDGYVQAHLEILERETDIKRRREAFHRFTDRLLWAADGGELPEEVSHERLTLLEKALVEQTKRHPFDGFYHEALAAVFERHGDSARAFKSMKQAYYTSPETPFSLGQLREAALRSSDLKSAIYFQKQITATAPAAELAAESRKLVELLEQTFQIAEADRVRRRLESRFSQDVTALENLAEHYKNTGQDEAERRVYEQISRVRPWDARSQLRIALKCLRLADDAGAKHYFQEILNKTQEDAWPQLSEDKLPLPISDLRKPGSSSPVIEITGLLDTVPGLDPADANRLRASLNLQHPEFAELPNPIHLLRLRVIEELARLHSREDSAALDKWVTDWKSSKRPAIERLWALYYAHAGADFRALLRETLKEQKGLETRFKVLWLLLRSHGMTDAIAWVRGVEKDDEAFMGRKRLLLACVSMLGDLNSFRFQKGALAELGGAKLIQNSSVLELTRDFQDQQRYTEALELGESLRKNSTALADDYAFFLSRIAESAQRWDLARDYLGKVVRGALLPGPYKGTYDPYLYSLSMANRLANSEQERERILQDAWKRLQRTPDSDLTRLRKSAVIGLAGAQDTAAAELKNFITGDFMGARRMGEVQGMLTPQGSNRHEEAQHLRGLWEETREIQASFVQQGLAKVVEQANDDLVNAWGSVGLSSRSGLEFTEWRLGHLSRQLRQVDYPNRLRLIREYLSGIDMRQEVSVEALSDLGGRLESQGMAREAIEVYRLLPARAPANSEYAQWLIRASESARETKMGLKFTLQLLLAEPPMKPPQPGNEVLAEKHAHFLAQDFDIEELHRRGFLPSVTQVLQGRIPPEVPYLRELALLHERLGQDAEAVAAWERLHLSFTANAESEILPDTESCLHLARLYAKQGKREDALKALRAVPLKNISGGLSRETLKLRADLLAQEKLWEEVRELMAAVVEKKLVPEIIHLADLLRTHGRTDDSLNLLTQGERSVKDENDRFTLRLEILKQLATASGWTPDAGRTQIAALFRVRSRDRETLEKMVAWMKAQSSGPNQKSWIKLLSVEARAGMDRPLAALALSAYAAALPQNAGEDLAQGWAAAGDGDRVCVELGGETLLKEGRPQWAWQACAVLQELPTLRLDGRKSPLMVRVAHAMGDRAVIQEFFAETIRRSVPGGVQPTEWARAFEDVGQPNLARELYQQALQKLEGTQSMQTELSIGWVRFLIRHKDFENAEIYLMKNHWALVNDSADLIFELYQGWGKLASLTQELPKFHLPVGIEKEVLFLRSRALGAPPSSPQP